MLLMTLFNLYYLIELFLKGFCLYLIGYVLVNLIAYTGTHELLCGNSSVSNNTKATSLINEHCFGQIIGTLIFTLVYSS
jgi:hypothetical protein